MASWSRIRIQILGWIRIRIKKNFSETLPPAKITGYGSAARFL